MEHAIGARRAGGADRPVTATLLIATYNRAPFLRGTLESVAALHTPPDVTWDVLVVDNNSSDDTRAVVEAAARWYPVPLTYLFEPRQGKSIALNTALAAIPSSLVLFSDDDVRMPADWLKRAVRPLIEDPSIAYVGGPVRPLWQDTPPAWLRSSSRSAGVLALLDYGPDPFVFEERRLIPLGVNMAVRRSLIERVGGFNAALGRRGASLLGQEQAEFFLRCRRIGARGSYIPGLQLEHVVAANRLSLRYFCRWWFWKGISQARWYRMHGETELGVDLTKVSRVFGIPRFVFGGMIAETAHALGAVLRRRTADAVDHFFMLAFYAGYIREVWFGPRSFPENAGASEPTRIETNAAAR